MPRRPRIQLDRVPLHLVRRGHNLEQCFFAEEDYLSYLHWLGEALPEAACELHAYVLMTNHVHRMHGLMREDRQEPVLYSTR
jgi:putative transposase